MHLSPRALALVGAALAGGAATLALRPLVPEPVPPPSLATDAPPRPAHASPAGAIVVYVAGAVVHPGVYRLPAGARADDALRRAGGALPPADLVAVNLAAPLADGDEVAVRRVGEATPRPARGRAPRAAGSRARHHGRATPTAQSRPQPAAALDLNRADAAALRALPGIGPGIAERIVAFRELNGPFASLDALLDVAGFAPSRLDRVAPFLTVQP